MFSVANEQANEKTINKIKVRPHSLIIWQVHMVVKVHQRNVKNLK